MEKDKKFWICSNLAGLTSTHIRNLLEIHHGSIEEIFMLSLSELVSAGIPKKLAEKIADELFKLNGSGTVKNATMLTPSFMNGNDKVEAGYYVKSEVVDLIKKVLKR